MIPANSSAIKFIVLTPKKPALERCYCMALVLQFVFFEVFRFVKKAANV